MGWNKLTAFNALAGVASTGGGGPAADQRYYTNFNDESAVIPDLAIVDGDVLEFDVYYGSTDTYNKIFGGATNNSQIQLYNASKSYPKIIVTSGGSIDEFVTQFAYAHGCWNNFKFTVSGSTLAVECNGVDVGSKTVVLPLSITSLVSEYPQTFHRNIKLTRGGSIVRQYNCDEESGISLVDAIDTANNGVFSDEPQRWEFTKNADDIWQSPNEPAGQINIPEYAAKYVYATEANKSISVTFTTGQSLANRFNSADTNNAPNARYPTRGYSTASSRYAGSFSTRHIGFDLIEQRASQESGYFAFRGFGVPSASVASLDEGTANYEKITDYITALEASLAANNDTITDFKVNFIQGENDRSNTDGYSARVANYLNNIKDSIHGLFPNIPVKFYRTQIVIGSDGGSEIMQQQVDFVGADYGLDDVFLGEQWSIEALNPNIAQGSRDGVHLATRGYQMVEEKAAEAYNTTNWKALQCLNAIADIENNGTTVTATMNVQTLPLLHDSRSEYEQAAHKNVRLIKSSGSVYSATSVVLDGANVVASFAVTVEAGDRISFARANIKDSTNWVGVTTGETHTHFVPNHSRVITDANVSDNTAPTANAGTNQTLAANIQGQLSGSGTVTTAGATITGYQWIAPAGITLNGANTANPTFTTPQLNAATTFTFSLVVTDSNGLTSVADTVDVVVEAYSPPVETDSSVLVLNVPTANGQYDVYLHTKEDGKEVVFDGVVTFNNGGATIQLDIDDGILLTGDATPVSNPTEFNSFGIWGVTQ